MEVLKKISLHSLLSQKCAICERSKQDPMTRLCEHCYDSLPHIGLADARPCFRCGIEIPFNIRNKNIPLSCGACLAKDPIQYRSFSAFHYLFPLPELIAQIKFQKQLEHLDLLAELFVQQCIREYQHDTLPQCIVPVPLHPHREFQRSFNQAELFSQRIAKQLGISCETNLVRRIRHTPSQMQLSIVERKKNMRNAFALNSHIEKSFDRQHLVIFDDVLTTGATAQSIGLLLKRAGVQRIDIWSLARTPKPT